MSAAETAFDAIVVGSGVSGGWAAKELTERGLKVLLLERGRMVKAGDDYVGEHKSPWEFRFHGLGDRRRYERDYPVQSRARVFEEGSEQFFVNDSEHPYQSDPERRFAWIRGYHLGGKSLTWGRATPRYSRLNFEEPGRDGHGTAWPIHYDDIAPWYSHVERFIGVSGARHGLESAPDGEFLPAFPLNCVEEHVQDVVAARFPGRTLISERCAVLSRDHGGRAACHLCGPCHRGCSTGSYFSSQSSTLPAAEATGRLTTLTDRIVAQIDVDPKTRRATGVATINAKTGTRETFTARIVFLNASTLPTTHIMLASRSATFPNGLANGSGMLGKYLMDQVKGSFVLAQFDGFEDKQPIGNRPNGFYVPQAEGTRVRSDGRFIGGYGFQGRAFRQMWTRGAELQGAGTDFKAELRRPGPWMMWMVGMGECLPYANNTVVLDNVHKDKWGLPQLRISYALGENEQLMVRSMTREAEAMLTAAGGKVLRSTDEVAEGGLAIHEMGTARMGEDPATSVLNAHNQAHEVPNLFVTDGAAMTSCPPANPSLTYMALTARACAYAVDRLKDGSL